MSCLLCCLEVRDVGTESGEVESRRANDSEIHSLFLMSDLDPLLKTVNYL